MRERTNALASHLPEADRTQSGSGLPELSHIFFGHADHHGIYSEPTFQSILLRPRLTQATRTQRSSVAQAAGF